VRTKGGNCGRLRLKFLGVGGLDVADEDPFGSERCPLPPARSFGSAVILIKAA